VHLAQEMNYLEAYNLQTGLLKNFMLRAYNLKEFSINLGILKTKI